MSRAITRRQREDTEELRSKSYRERKREENQSPRHVTTDPTEEHKRIQTDQLIDRLIANVCSPKPIMDESQVQLALALLNKLLPDLRAVQLTVDADSPLAITER